MINPLEPRQVYEEVMRRYLADVPDGRSTDAHCERWADEFTRLYRDYGKQLTVAAANAASVWMLCGDRQRAERDFATLIGEVPRYTAAYNDLAVLRWRRGDRVGAIATLERGIEIVDGYGRAMHDDVMRENLATMVRLQAIEFDDRAAFDRAELRIRELLAADAAVLALYEELALLYLARVGRDGPRMVLLASLVVARGRAVAEQLGGARAGLENAAGLVALARDDPREARRCFERAIAADPAHFAAQSNLGMLAVRSRDHATARVALETARADPARGADLDDALALATVYIAEARYHAARRVLRTATRVHDDARPWFMLGVLDQDFVGPAAERAATQGFDARFYRRARASFEHALSLAVPTRRRDLIDAAHARIEAIDSLFTAPGDTRRMVEAQAARLEAEARKAEAAEKKRLLELERKLRALQ